MQLLPWWPDTGEGVLVYVGMLLVYTLGLYVLTRGEGRVAVLACLAMGTFAVYLLGLWAGGLAFPDEPLTWAAWLRATWWGGALSPGLWLLLVFVLAVDEGPEAIRAKLQAFLLPVAVGVLGLGGVFAVLGMTGDLLLRWDDAFPLAALVVVGSDPWAWHVPPTPLFTAYQVYLIACLVGAAFGLAWLFVSSPRGAPLRSRFGGLLASAVLFLLGGTYMGVASGGLGFSGLPGEVLLVIGMIILGWNVARYGALLAGEAVAADFRAFFLSTLAVVLLYAALFTFVPRPLELAARRAAAAADRVDDPRARRPQQPHPGSPAVQPRGAVTPRSPAKPVGSGGAQPRPHHRAGRGPRGCREPDADDGVSRSRGGRAALSE